MRSLIHAAMLFGLIAIFAPVLPAADLHAATNNATMAPLMLLGLFAALYLGIQWASGTTSFTAEEIDYIAENVLSRKIADRKVNPLDRVEDPVMNMMMARAKEVGPPIKDGFKFFVKGKRGQKLQFWDGADILTFENRHTVTEMVFDVGRCHMGFELLYQFLEQQGIVIDYRKGIQSGAGNRSGAAEVVWNVIEDHLDSVMDDWATDMRKRFWRANTDQAKAWAGVDALFPATTTFSGTIGGRPRSNVLFQHHVVTALTKTNFQLNFVNQVKLANRRAGKTKIEIFACGDDAYQVLVDLFSGTDTSAGKFDFRAAKDMAMKKGEKYNVALPQDCFAYENSLIINSPVFEELDIEEPTANPTWGKRIYGFNPGHFGIIPVKDQEKVMHGAPYNQMLERTSLHGQYVEWCNQPGTQMVGVFS
jgi:hypothetical protein